MSDRRKLLYPVLSLLAAGLVAGLLIVTRPEVERQESVGQPPLVQVITVHRSDRELTVRSQGTVRPSRESTLVAQVAGRIDWVAPQFAEGAFFLQDQQLLRIDDRDYRLAIARAEAELAQARVRLQREEAEAEVARAEWQEVGSAGDPPPLALHEPQLAEARAAVQAAEAAVAKAQLDLERTRVTAPFDGRLRSKRADLGQFVAPGTPLATTYSIEAAEIRLPVAAEDLSFLELDLGFAAGASHSGPAVTLEGRVGDSLRTWRGRIVRTGSEIDPRTRMLPLVARVDDPFLRRRREPGTSPLPVGLFVEARIRGRLAEEVVVIPRSALRERDQVLVVDGEDRLRFRRVEVLRHEGEETLIRAGLEEGERICVSPLDAAVDGMRVRTVPHVERARSPIASREVR